MLHSSAALVFRTHATFGLQNLEGTEFSSGFYSFHIPSEKQWECSRISGMLCPMIFRRTALCSVLVVVHTIPLQKQWNNVHSTLLLLYCSCSRVRKCTRAEEWCSISSWLSGRLCNVQCASIPKSFHLPPDQTPLICKHTCFCQNLKKTYLSKLLQIHYANEGPP